MLCNSGKAVTSASRDPQDAWRMNRRQFLKAAGAIALSLPAAGVFVGCARRALKADGVERILLMVCDSMRADHLGCYRPSQRFTPHIDAFAKSAVRFANAYAISGWTTPSNAALFTGKYPREVRARATARLNDDARTAADCFRDAGFATAGFSAQGLVSEATGLNQGFDTFVSEVWGDESVATRCIEWMRAHRNERFFALLYMMRPHWPYQPEEAGASFVVPEANVRPNIAQGWLPIDYDKRIQHVVRCPRRRREVSWPELAYLRELYKGSIASADARVGRVLDAVSHIPKLAVVLASDHGEEWLEHDGLSHQFTLYDELLRIPLIISAPGEARMRTVQVVRTQVTSLDVMPTLLALAGIEAPSGLRGMSLLPPTNLPRRPLFAEEDGWSELGVLRYGVRLGNDVLIWNLSALSDEPKPPEGGSFERYNLVKDLFQQHPQPLPDKTDPLLSLLHDFRKLTGKLSVPGERPVLDQQTKDALRAIGYIGR